MCCVKLTNCVCQTLKGKYEIISIISDCTYGSVVLAKDIRNGSTMVAIKMSDINKVSQRAEAYRSQGCPSKRNKQAMPNEIPRNPGTICTQTRQLLKIALMPTSVKLVQPLALRQESRRHPLAMALLSAQPTVRRYV